MESANVSGEMSPLYVPRKRRSALSHLRGGSLRPVVQRIPERSSGSTEVPHQNVVSNDQEAVKMKRTCRGKRFQDLSCDSDPTASCPVVSSALLANGPAAPATVMSPSSEDSCPHQPGGSEERDPEPGQDQSWSSVRGPGQAQSWQEPGREPSGDQAPVMGLDVWRPEPNRKKVKRAKEQNTTVITCCLPPEVSTCYPVVVDGASSAPPTGEHTPAVTSPTPKKEPPTYPPGSPEERWQLQIAARGRVPCPTCRNVSRKTVEGLKKHMENCRQEWFSCQHCGKKLRSSTGMKYHVMAHHRHLPAVDTDTDMNDRAVRDELRKILKRLGKLKCSKEGCHAAFTSVMGYMYHRKTCGKEESELEKMLLSCCHCGKVYRSRAGLEYHLKSEHAPTAAQDQALEAQPEDTAQRTPSGRVQRASAQVANFQLAEIANNDLPKDWPKRKFPSDLVPQGKKLKYSRPGLPAFSQEVLRKWRSEVKLQRRVQCPNQGCGSTYTSVSGLKAHLGLCSLGEFEVGKFRCLICTKEFTSESGVKYHINSIHSQDWFLPNKKASKKFDQFLKNQSKELVLSVDKQIVEQYHRHHLHHHHLHHHHHHHHHLQQQDLQEECEEAPLHFSLEPAVPGSEQAPLEMELEDGERAGCGAADHQQGEPQQQQ